MREYDPELIFDLVAGDLPPAEAAALEARIAADPKAAAELLAQRATLSALRQATPARLTAAERTTLHAAVASRLGLEPGQAPVARTRRAVPWGAIAVAASAIVAIVAVAPMMSLLDRGSDDALTAADGAATTTQAGAAEFDASTGGEAPAMADTATVETTATGTGGPTTLATALAERAGEPPAVAQDLMLLAADPEAVQVLEQPIDEATLCVAEAETYFGSFGLTYFEYPMETEEAGKSITFLVFHLAAPDGTTGALVAFDPADCTVPIPVP